MPACQGFYSLPDYENTRGTLQSTHCQQAAAGRADSLLNGVHCQCHSLREFSDRHGKSE